MGTAVAPGRTRKSKSPTNTGRSKAETNLVDELMKITVPMLAQLSPSEREARIRKFSDHLAALEGNVAKRA